MHLLAKEKWSQSLKTNSWLPKGTSSGGGDGLEVWDWHMHPVVYGMSGQWGTTVQHKQRYLIFCDNLCRQRI